MRGLHIASLLLLSCASPQRAPSTLTLQSTDGTTTTLTDLLHQSKATVIVFWSAQCPCVARYQSRIDALAADWSKHDITFIEVGSNAGEPLESLREAAQSRKLPRPLWRDEGGHLAKQLGARSTPSVVLLTRDGRVLYRGWVDNERLPGEKDREPWLEQALNAFVNGGAAASKSPTWGCSITRSLSACFVGGSP